MWKRPMAGRGQRSLTRRLQTEPLESRQLLAGDLVAQWVAHDLNPTGDEPADISRWRDRIGGIEANSFGTPQLVPNMLSTRSVVRLDPSDGSDWYKVDKSVSPISNANDFSVSVVFSTQSQSLIGGNGPWHQNTGLVDANQASFSKDWGISLNAAGQAAAGMSPGGFDTGKSVYSDVLDLNDGNVHLVTMARSGSQIDLYVDGNLAGSTNEANDGPRAMIDVTFGVLQSHQRNPFAGDLAEVQMHNGALSASEAAALYEEMQGTYNNAAPIAVDDVYELQEGPLLGFHVIQQSVSRNDIDAEGDELTAELVTGASAGDIILRADGTFVYAPDRDFFGVDSFTYVATTKNGQSSEIATVTLNVANVYDAPKPVDDRYKAIPTEPIEITAADGILANDQNLDNATLFAVLKDDVTQGILELSEDGSFRYDSQGISGEITFTYRIDDRSGNGLSPSGTVTLVVNTPPVAVDDIIDAVEDGLLGISMPDGIGANDVDAENDQLTYTLIETTTHGTLTLESDGDVRYVPFENFHGTDSFTYQVSDGEDSSEVATVTINVHPVNDIPTSVADYYFTEADTSLVVNAPTGLLRNDTDIDETELSSRLVEQPTSGSLSLSSDGSFVYTPTAGFRGLDSFQYLASDGQVDTAPTLVTISVGTPFVRINEIMAANAGSLETRLRPEPTKRFRGHRDTPDWIELKNINDFDVDLTGYHLSDSRRNAQKWSFPKDTIIPANDFLVVFASRLNILDRGLDEHGYLHTNFKLDVTGEYLGLISPQLQVIDEIDGYGEQRGDISYGISEQGEIGHLTNFTPGAQNAPTIYVGLVEAPEISQDRGFFEHPFEVTISPVEPDTVVRYTVNGSQPTETNGTDYSGPITITTTTVLKAVAFRPGFVPSLATAQTYLFGADVLQQDNSGPEGAISWGHNGSDYEMDPIIVNHEDPEIRPVVEDLKRIPTVSVAIDNDLFFGERDDERGIYIIGENVEKPITFEFFDPELPNASVQTNSTIQIVGGSSPGRWKSDKLSMRIRFTEDAGESELNFPIFGANAATEFDTLVLDARLNNVWHYGGGSSAPLQRANAQYLRDEFAADLQNAVGGFAPHNQHVHVYINGIYWGLHTMHERPDENFQASYQGGTAEDYNVIKHTRADIINGSNETFGQLNDIVGRGRDPLTDEQYHAAAELLDTEGLIDYILINYYGGNGDWDHHNWYASQSPLDGKWRFHSWDAEKFLESLSANRLGLGTRNAPTGIHQRMLYHPEYRLKFADAVEKHFYNGGAMTPEAAQRLYHQRAEEINLVTRVESARWGDNQIDNGLRKRYTRQDWINVRDNLYESHFPARTENVLEQMERIGMFEPGQAPQFYVNNVPQHGGAIAAGISLSMTAPEGTIYYTTDGSDPRLAFGAVAEHAQTYTGPIDLAETTNVRARLRRADDTWGPISSARFVTSVPASSENLIISEIHYHPANVTRHESLAGFDDADEFEFIELVNVSEASIDLMQVHFQRLVDGDSLEGIDFQFTDSHVTELAPGERVVVVENTEAFVTRYGGGIQVAGEWSGGLSNNSENIRLMVGDTVIAEFAYDDAWHPTTDGGGPSLQAVNEAPFLPMVGSKASWKPSSSPNGTPGRGDQEPARIAGDINGDGTFTSEDLALAFIAGKYEDDTPDNASYEEGDWNGDGDFTSEDIVYVFIQGNYAPDAMPTTFAPRSHDARDLVLARDDKENQTKDTPDDASNDLMALDRMFAEI